MNPKNKKYILDNMSKKSSAQIAAELGLKSYVNLGIAYFNIGERRKGMELFKKALEINPYSANTCLALSVAYHKENDYVSAIKYCDKASELGYTVDPELLKAIKPFRERGKQ